MRDALAKPPLLDWLQPHLSPRVHGGHRSLFKRRPSKATLRAGQCQIVALPASPDVNPGRREEDRCEQEPRKMNDDPRSRTNKKSTKSLKAVAYEQATEGIPPRKGQHALELDGKRPSSQRSQLSATSDVSQHRQRASPAPSHASSPRRPFLEDDNSKRDSCFSTADSHVSVPTAGGAAREPTLPTIVIQDEESPGAFERERPIFGSKKKIAKKELLSRKSSSPPRIARMSSFKGLTTSIPTTSSEDLKLDDLASDKVTFSHRGSLLFGGKKMQDLIAAKGAEGVSTRADGRISPMRSDRTQQATPEPASNRERSALPVEKPLPDALPPQAQEPPPEHAPNGEQPKKGLVTGRRKPSVQMLQAAIQGGRVLSAEEITFSLKVRSMYDHGDERAAEWTSAFGGLDGAINEKHTPESDARDSNTPELMTNGDLAVNKTRTLHASKSTPSMNGVDPRASSYSKEATELAGGIEDWDDIDGKFVDRYGFIRQDVRAESRASTRSEQPEGRGMQRIATSLRVESAMGRRHRQVTRKSSISRSLRSLPGRSSNDLSTQRGAESVHSTHSNVSSRSTNPFRSKNRKVLAEASDMLTLPPVLANIDEVEDAGDTASSLKQREWDREEKWQKMAKLIRHRGEAKGGGMRFEFDTNDPKVIERTWKGIPDRWRATAWHSFLSTSAKKRNVSVTDEELIGQFHKLQALSSADDVQIDVDVPRTVNLHIMFRRRYRGGQRLLFRVLHAVSLYFPDTGYVQGMASLAATLLCYFDEEHAFVMMVRLWQLRGLEQLYQAGFQGLMTCLDDFETHWLRGGDVSQRLKDLNIQATAYGTRWYLTLFNMSVPFQAQLRVWDVFMLLGDAAGGQPVGGSETFGGADLDILHATSAALIDATREILLDSDFENAMKVLTSFVPVQDEDLLMRVARAEYRMKKKRGVVGAGSVGEKV